MASSTSSGRDASFVSNVGGGGSEFSDFQGGLPGNVEFPQSGRSSTLPMPVPRVFNFHKQNGETDIDRAFFPLVLFIPVFVRVRFTVGTGTAALTLRHLSSKGDQYGVQFHTATVGVGTDLFFKLAWDELRSGAWIFGRDDGIKIDWVSPDGTIVWAVEIGIVTPLAM